MNRTRMLLKALLVGAALIGPIAAYAGAVVSFGVGFESSYPLTRYAGQTLIMGSIIGSIAGIVCGATGCRARRSALWSGGVVFLIEIVALVILTVFVQPLAPQQVPSMFGDMLLYGMIAAVVGYFTARISFEWEKKSPAATRRAAGEDLPSSSNRGRYSI